MGKQLVTKIRGMNPLAKKGVLVIWAFLISFACILGPKGAEAAISVLNPFQAGATAYNVNNTYGFYKGTAFPGAAAVGTIAPAAGSNRVLVVAVTTAVSAVATQTCTVTYNSVSMTQAIGDGTTSARQHSYLFYLPLGTSATAGAAVRPVVAIANTPGTVTTNTAVVTSAVFAGVDQATVVRAPSKNYNGGTSTTTTVGPFAAPLLAINAGDYAVEVVHLFRTSGTNPRTITTWAPGWSVTALMAGTYASVTQGTSSVYVRGNTTATAGTNSQHTASNTATKSMSAMVLRPAGITVATGTNVAAQNVYAGDLGKVVNAFTMTGVGTVTDITVTGNANTTTTNVSSVKIYRKGAANLNMSAVESGDTQIGSGAASPTTTTITVNEPVAALTNYIVVYDIAATAVANAATISLAGTVSAITPSAATLADTNTPAAPLTILATTTVGTGIENPASSRLTKLSSPTNIDAFTLSHNGSASDNETTITNITVTLTPNLISGAGNVWSKFKLLEITDAAGVPLGSLDKVTLVDAWNIPVTGLTVTSTPTTYYVRGTTADVINPSVNDTSGTINGFYPPANSIQTLVTAVTGAKNKLVFTDTVSSATTIDVERPIDSATISVLTGTNPGEINLSWGQATDANGGVLDVAKPYQIMRSIVNGAVPDPGCINGTDISTQGATINYIARTATDTGLGKIPSQNYAYRICAVDAQGNKSLGLTAAANAKIQDVCYNQPIIELSPITQVIKSVDTVPFRLVLTSQDVGECLDAVYNLALIDVSGNQVNFDRIIGINGVDTAFPADVTLGVGGSGAPTSLTTYVKISGKPTANQLEDYSFKVKVTNSNHSNDPKAIPPVIVPGSPYSYTTPAVTGTLNDMPPIVHNSNNMAKRQYEVNGVDWGSRYTCATCHSNSTTNIKGIFQVISTPIGRRDVIFNTISSTPAQSIGVYGNDNRQLKNTSNNVCEVCHHKTRQHQYSANKQYGGPNNNELYNSDHHNSRDCVACHTHNTAFRSIYGLCGDCHGFKATGYSPVSRETMVRDPLTNALGPVPPNYGAHQKHFDAKLACAACHNNTNHGLLTSTWSGDNKLQMGFSINKDNFPGFNQTKSINNGTFNASLRLNNTYTWTQAPGTTINIVDDYNNSCVTYCHGGWSGNQGGKTNPFWVGDGVEIVCGNCHYATKDTPPVSGSHQKHAGILNNGNGISCNRCHASFSSYTTKAAIAHINGDVEWKFDPAHPTTQTALYKPAGASSAAPAGSTGGLAPSATYGTCSQLYCHSNVQGIVNGTGLPTLYASPKWGDASTATCGSCHKYPNDTGSHVNHENGTVGFDCHVCHDNGGTTTATNHANGKIDFKFVGLAKNTRYFGMTSLGVTPGSGYGQCSNSDCHGRSVRTWGVLQSALTMCEKCHGSATSAGGFYSTRGPATTMSIYSAGVGVHDIHIQNPNSPRKATFKRFTSLAAGYSCRQCHTVPTGPFSAGHVDTAIPAEVPFNNSSSIASKGKAVFGYSSTATYNSADQSCSSVWCHGGGMNSNRAVADYAGTTLAQPRTNPKWNVPYLSGTSTDCGKCHQSPPPAKDASSTHYGKTLANCYECHFHVNPDGTSFNNKSLHANGKIEGGCTDCHGNPPIVGSLGGPDGLVTKPVQNAITVDALKPGAHNAHQLLPIIGSNCNTCHNNYNRVMKDDGTGRLEIEFNGLGGLVTSGTFTGYSNTKWNPSRANTTILRSSAQTAVCSNLYCHGGGAANASPARPALGGGNNTTPDWQVPAVCGDCHGIDSANAPTGGSHTRHATQIPSIVCANCHGETSPNGTHVNGAVSWHLDTQNPLFGANATYNGMSSGSITGLAPRGTVTAGDDYRTCSNIYCHSSVQNTTGLGTNLVSFKSPRWGTDNTTLTCGSCHNDNATDLSAPGSHKKHANTTGSGMAVSCGYCHQDAGFGYALHTDGSVFVNFTSYISINGGSKYGGYSTPVNKAAGSAAYTTCSNTFCHGIAPSPAWGTVGTLACNKCHSAKVDDVSWSGRHKTHYNYSTMPSSYTQTVDDVSSATKYRFNCAHCHDDNVARHSLKPASADSAARVFFGISSATPAANSRRGLYAAGTAKSATDNGFKFTAGSCNTSYCHSNGKGGMPKVTTFLNWTTRPVAAGNNCAFCHDTKSTSGTATSLSGKHDKHMNSTLNTFIGTNSSHSFNCVDCHAPVITNSDNRTLANKRNHVNAVVNYSGARAYRTGYTLGSGNCTTYCHSNGNPSAIAFVNMTGSKAWGSGTTYTINNCNKCHGRSNAYGYPDYANGGANTTTSNLHAGHMAGMASTTACSDCHRRTVDTIVADKFRPYSTQHLSGSTNVNFNAAKSYIGPNAVSTPSGNLVTCSNVICHGQAGTAKLQWGGKKSANSGNAGVRTCTKCHGTTTTADYLTNYSSAMIAPGYNGEGTDTSMVNSAATSPRVGAHQRHLVSNVISAPVKCGECHLPVTNMRDGSHWNYSTATLTFRGTRATITTPTVARVGGIFQCSNVYCHSRGGATMPTPFWNVTGIVREAGNTVGECVKCHAMPPQTGTHLANGIATLGNFSSISKASSCRACHYNVLAAPTSVSNVFADVKLHVNGINNEVTMSCNSCHSYLASDSWTSAYGPEGIGAHKKHITYLIARTGATLTPGTDTYGGTAMKAVCGVCHTIDIAQHTTATPSNPRSIVFGTSSTTRQFGTLHAKYNGVSGTSSSVNPKSCSNTDCHYRTSPIWSTY